MNRKYSILAIFALLVIAQLIVPFRMISNQATSLKNSTELLFKVSHGRDGFKGRASTGITIQGRFIWLELEADHCKAPANWDPKADRTLFVTFAKDSMGYATIASATKEKPVATSDWVVANAFRFNDDSDRMRIFLPFNKYFIKDENIKEIVSDLSNKLNESQSEIVLKVLLREDKYVARELLINKIPFEEYVKTLQANPRQRK